MILVDIKLFLNKNIVMSKKSRRNFIKKSSVLGAGFFIVPRNVLGGVGFTPPSDQLNIASIGSGGKGADIQNSWASKERVVALCLSLIHI